MFSSIIYHFSLNLFFFRLFSLFSARQGVPSSCLELPNFSTYSSQQLQRLAPSEFATPNPADGNCRYAVSDTALSADRRSYWAAVIKANAWYIMVGVIGDKGVQHDSGQHNRGQPTFFAVQVLYDCNWRYAVSNTALPADRRSCWAAVVKANAHVIIVGVIGNRGVQHNSGNCNFDQPTCCGVQVDYDGTSAWVYTNGSQSDNHVMASAAGDVLLFRLDPLQRQLMVVNSRTRQATDITEVAHGDPQTLQPLYITVNLMAAPYIGSLTQLELRQVTAAERAMLQ